MISEKAQKLKPYVYGEQPQDRVYTKLNTNENPYKVSPKVKKILDTFDLSNLKKYPDPECIELKKAIAKLENVDVENVFIGNGSDEVLAFAFYALFDTNIAFADITYSFYPVYCNMFDISYKTISLKDDFTIDTQDYLDNNYGGIVIANPNAPTSISLEFSKLESLIKKVNCNVIIDEAYIDFATKSKSCTELVKTNNNLLVVKTFSKSYSLAGIRCGYAVGDSTIIKALDAVKNSFNSYTVDMLCQSIALVAVEDRAYFDKCKNMVIATRQNFVNELKSLGFVVLDSDANFVFTKKQGLSGERIYSYLKENQILVRHFNADKISDYVRISIGTDSQMEEVIEKLRLL